MSTARCTEPGCPWMGDPARCPWHSADDDRAWDENHGYARRRGDRDQNRKAHR